MVFRSCIMCRVPPCCEIASSRDPSLGLGGSAMTRVRPYRAGNHVFKQPPFIVSLRPRNGFGAVYRSPTFDRPFPPDRTRRRGLRSRLPAGGSAFLSFAVAPVGRYSRPGGGSPTVTKTLEETCCNRSLLVLLYVTSPIDHNAHSFAEPRLKTENALLAGEARR